MLNNELEEKNKTLEEIKNNNNNEPRSSYEQNINDDLN